MFVLGELEQHLIQHDEVLTDDEHQHLLLIMDDDEQQILEYEQIHYMQEQ
jgi:hypothetical protein